VNQVNQITLTSVIAVLCFSACQQTGSAPKLQSHLSAAKSSSDQTSKHIQSVKGNLETIDFKAGRAKKLLEQGVEK
jgi:outer membrane lipoprotein-sorting protein